MVGKYDIEVYNNKAHYFLIVSKKYMVLEMYQIHQNISPIKKFTMRCISFIT